MMLNDVGCAAFNLFVTQINRNLFVISPGLFLFAGYFIKHCVTVYPEP